MMFIDPRKWSGSYRPPALKDVRWSVFGLLASYLLLGLTLLGFSRQPLHVLLLVVCGAILDMALSGLIRGRKQFPLSAIISCCSLALLLNWSYGINNMWLPVFICISSKYLITLKGRHFFNPSLLAICVSIVLGHEYITLAPAYQWYGGVETAWLMIWFIITGAIFLFVLKINRGWLIGSFFIVFLLQTLYRAHVMEHIIPWETLFLSSVTSPAFYLFTFYMITDPATSPNGRRQQILTGTFIALFDLLFHLKFSLYTFFFAGLTVAAIRYAYFLFRDISVQGIAVYLQTTRSRIPHLLLIGILFIPAIFAFNQNNRAAILKVDESFVLERVPQEHSGLGWSKGKLLEQVDEKIAHVAKWILSIGDAVAVADVNQDGLPDIFLTQPLKGKDWQAKLYLNKGDFQFEKTALPGLEKYLENVKEYGVPAFSFFLDHDNDGDKDLFVGFAFGESRLYENKIVPTGRLEFEEMKIAALGGLHTVCLAANAFDYNNDGNLDLLIGNALEQYLPGYQGQTEKLNIFDLPEPEFEGDERMFQFMHESWHNANNGGLNFLLRNTGDSLLFEQQSSASMGLGETRWSLAVGTLDINDDGYTDLYIANDFGRDDCYLNVDGRFFERQEGHFYGDLGLDTYKGMNVSAGDLDRNGKEDIYVSNVHHAMQAEGSLLWMNYTPVNATKASLKEEATKRNALNTNRFGWGAAMGDLNLDGWTDILQANGMVNAAWDPKFEEPQDYWYYQAQIARTGPEVHSFANNWADIRGCYIYPDEPDRVLINNDGKGFVDLAAELGFDHLANTRGVGLADFDNDGDLDVLVTDQFGSPVLYKNNITNHRWLGLILKGNGRDTNVDAVGSKVWLSYTIDGDYVEQYKEMRLVNGFSSMGDTRILFGLDHKSHKVEDIKVKIQWHNGPLQSYRVDTTDTYIVLSQETVN